ncbi:MAG: cell division protein ZapA, partial [Lachnospiraceae bacterium]|nr:cell division protein ZapA [Lachnospiraceae bacterium]
LLDLNVADDYFKLKKQADQLGEQMSVKDRELYDLKHEFIQTQMKLESTSKTLETLQQNAAQDQKRIIQLETLLNQSKNRK